MPEVSKEEQRIALDKRRWENRRRMAWAAFKLASTLTVLLMIATVTMWFNSPVEAVEAASEWGFIVLGAIGGLWSVVGAYIGFAAYSDVRLFGGNNEE